MIFEGINCSWKLIHLAHSPIPHPRKKLSAQKYSFLTQKAVSKQKVLGITNF